MVDPYGFRPRLDLFGRRMRHDPKAGLCRDERALDVEPGVDRGLVAQQVARLRIAEDVNEREERSTTITQCSWPSSESLAPPVEAGLGHIRSSRCDRAGRCRDDVDGCRQDRGVN